MKTPNSGGGWPAIRYVFRAARRSGGLRQMWRALRSKNTCKTCALGMGGQRGGMVNEAGSFPEFCKKSVQALAADMQGGIPAEFWSTYGLAQLREFSPYDLERRGRLVQPVHLRPGDDYYHPISWDEALVRVTDRLRAVHADQSFWYFSGRSSNEAGFLLQLFARLYGTNNVNNCSFYCHQASGVGLTQSLGTGTATIQLDDLEKADLVFLIGGNPASNHPRLMTSLMKIRRRGGAVAVINPVLETGLRRFRVPSNPRSLLFGTSIASHYVQPHIGGDQALLSGIAKHIVELDRQDHSFLAEHCEGADAWIRALKETDWSALERQSGVDRREMRVLAQVYAASRATVFAWTMGITHHAHGVQNVQMITNLALLRGMIGRPHAGVMPIRGHSNVQGMGSIGVTPQLKQAIFDRLVDRYQIELPTSKGLDTLGCIESAAREEMELAFCLGGNLFGSNPDAAFAEAALAKVGTVVYLNTTLNTGHARGVGRETLILPVLARDEEPQPTTQESMFNFVRMSDGGPARLQGPRSEIQVISDLASSVLGSSGPIDWASMGQTAQIREMIGQVVPGYEEIGKLDRTREEFYIGGRTLHAPKFPTTSGRANIISLQPPELASGDGCLRLMTVRSEGQFNTVVYEPEDLYRGQERRDVVLIHPDDLQRLGLNHDDRVDVIGPAGTMTGIRARSFDRIKSGNVLMYYPEANRLLPRVADPQSRTPAFKGALVKIVATNVVTG